jgi:formate dehydrogenase subunit gamma
MRMNHCPDPLPATRETILRFVTTERLLHWAIALPFLGCLVSATVLVVVYNHDPTGAHRPIFAWMHRGCGAALILGPSLVLLTSGRHARIHLYNIRQAWVWTFDDLKWLALMGLAAVSKRIILPDQGKFNAAEKLNFMMVMVCSPLFIATGLLIWFPDTTKLGSFFPWMVHCGLAALAIPLVLGHMVMATINPSTRVGLKGMISGFVSREWAAHHYARWFREQFPDLLVEHADERTLEAGVIVQASACSELRPLSATVAPLPVETALPSLAFAPGASFGNGCLVEPIAHTVADAVVARIHEPGSVVDDGDEVRLPARNEAPAAPEALCGDRSPDGVMAAR